MNPGRRWGLADLAALLIIVITAGGVRGWYLATGADGGHGAAPLEVQGQPPRIELDGGVELRGQKQPSEFDDLVHNLQEYHWFGSLAPLADKEERTAHIAPAYPWLLSLIGGWTADEDMVARWCQAVLGTLTAACYFLFARRAFQSLIVGLLAGLLAACHPFWIVNTAEIGDGVLATFLLAACLMLGTRASQTGGPFASLLFGLALAALAMTRAALLPFAIVSLLWFLWHCRAVRAGWFCALLAVLGFANGLVPWSIRNYREFEEPIPLVDSAMLNLWIGNNSLATGGPLTEAELRKSLPPERLQALLAEPNQAKRYNALGKDVAQELTSDPAEIFGRRLWAGLMFVFGENWFKNHALVNKAATSDTTAPPAWLMDNSENALRGSLLAFLVLGFLGWRFTWGWRGPARLATLAMLWVPLPYILGHADYLSGPRLPLDGVLICFSSFALAMCLPGARREPEP